MTAQDTKTDKMTEIRDYEDNCNGFEEHYQHWLRRATYSASVKFVAETAEAYWLIDAIMSHQTPRVRQITNGFQVWTLTKNKKGFGARLACTDGGQGEGEPRVAVMQRIEYTDFPLPSGESIEFYLEGGVLMLKAER